MFAEQPVAIIDIGSNSVRLVVYSGAKRIPSVIFNEKVLAGLGREVGAIGEAAQQRALAALDRFRLLVRQMGVVRTRTVATAAVREASNGAAFLARGPPPRLRAAHPVGRGRGEAGGAGASSPPSPTPTASSAISAAAASSWSTSPRGQVGRRASLPLGVLRLDALLEKGEASFFKKVGKAVAGAGFEGAAAGRPFYLVGGSWRTLARLDMALTDHPLPITHQHVMPTDRPEDLKTALAKIDKGSIRDIPSVSLSRFPTLPNANLLLQALVGVLDPDELIVSGFGIREGLLYDELPPERARARPADRGGARGRGGARPLRAAWRLARRLDRAGLRRRPARWRGCASPPACSPTSAGPPIPISAPSAASTWRCTAIGWRSTRPAG